MSNVTHMQESCPSYEWVTSRMSMSHVARIDESCRRQNASTYISVSLWMSHGKHISESCHSSEWVMSLISVTVNRVTHVDESRPVTHMRESCHFYWWGMSGIEYCHVNRCLSEWAISLIWMSHVTDMNYGVAMTSRLFKMIGLFCKRALQKRWYSAKETYDFKEPTNRSHHIVRSRILTSHVTLGTLPCALVCLSEWAMSLIWMSHVTHVNESWPSYRWVMSRVEHCHVPWCVSRNEPCQSYEWVMSLMWMSHDPHIDESCHAWNTAMCIGVSLGMSHVTHMK